MKKLVRKSKPLNKKNQESEQPINIYLKKIDQLFSKAKKKIMKKEAKTLSYEFKDKINNLKFNNNKENKTNFLYEKAKNFINYDNKISEEEAKRIEVIEVIPTPNKSKKSIEPNSLQNNQIKNIKLASYKNSKASNNKIKSKNHLLNKSKSSISNNETINDNYYSNDNSDSSMTFITIGSNKIMNTPYQTPIFNKNYYIYKKSSEKFKNSSNINSSLRVQKNSSSSSINDLSTIKMKQSNFINSNESPSKSYIDYAKTISMLNTLLTKNKKESKERLLTTKRNLPEKMALQKQAVSSKPDNTKAIVKFIKKIPYTTKTSPFRKLKQINNNDNKTLINNKNTINNKIVNNNINKNKIANIKKIKTLTPNKKIISTSTPKDKKPKINSPKTTYTNTVNKNHNVKKINNKKTNKDTIKTLKGVRNQKDFIDNQLKIYIINNMFSASRKKVISEQKFLKLEQTRNDYNLIKIEPRLTTRSFSNEIMGPIELEVTEQNEL